MARAEAVVRAWYWRSSRLTIHLYASTLWGLRGKPRAKKMYNSNIETKEVKIADITPSTRKFSVTFKVLNVGEEKQITSRRDGSQHRVADVLVGDETGVAVLTAWDDEIDQFRKIIGDTVSLINGYVSLYQGKLRLGLGRFGSIKPSGSKIEEVNEENNISEKEFEREFASSRRGRGRRYY